MGCTSPLLSLSPLTLLVFIWHALPTALCCVEVPVEDWRTRLWQFSLSELGCSNSASLAPGFAACFHNARLGNLQLFPGVRVSQAITAGCRACYGMCFIRSADLPSLHMRGRHVILPV